MPSANLLTRSSKKSLIKKSSSKGMTENHCDHEDDDDTSFASSIDESDHCVDIHHLSPIKPKKRVTFCMEARIRRVSSWKNFSDAEIEATWYSQDDFREFRRRCSCDVQRMNAGEEVSCTRGLESHTKVGRAARHKNKTKSIDAVLDEQDAQWDAEEEGDGNQSDCTSAAVEAIALAYRKVNMPSQLSARQVGLSDWNEIKDYLFSESSVEVMKHRCMVQWIPFRRQATRYVGHIDKRRKNAIVRS